MNFTSLTWRDGRLTDDEVTPEELRHALVDPTTLVWADFVNPAREDLEELFTSCGIPLQAVEDALEPGERTKIVRHTSHSLVTMYAMVPDGEDELRPSRITALALPDALLTVRIDDAFDITTVTRRWADAPQIVRSSVAGLLHGLLDTVIDGHLDLLDDFDDRVDRLEADIFESTAPAELIPLRIHDARTDLATFRRVMIPLRDVVTGLQRHHSADDLRPWFDDLYDHTIRVADLIETLRETVASLFETHLALQNAKLNTIMKKLAAWAAIIAVPTAVTGWFGQNVPYPGYGEPFGLVLSVGVILGAATALWAVFRRLDWV